ncbi:NADP-dependent 3-hydroxy acid dehydrogenase YdfG [Chitinophaga skermanii]|uniref:NADP-dependent 3-hydroxy acid dehydrogenase YdfG n=1 Tax=Chitinophaga skermanii TaxID=331697 RepID=A0A327QT01_9BACT|nr:SDR family oxidoreductase [Chitinophaga skermanii]RAJ06543.1 NADP-dependent 3-hydroxy acid dehydrogenase YdfG [Chitinophaga skermanii]
MKNKTWFITGASQGIGLILAQSLLSAGYNVIATSRNIGSLQAKIDPQAAFLPLEMQITNEESVQAAIEKGIATFGTIDVLVNNAGYGQVGTLEELSAAEVQRNFDVNVFGALHVIRHLLPHMRANGHGQIYNIASIGAYTGEFAGWGIYCATKFAMAGFTESLAMEVKEFGISATIVYPGYFRTNFLASTSMSLPANPIAAYTTVRASETMHQHDINGNQPGDPSKAANVLIAVSNSQHIPLHLFLGSDAYGMATNKANSVMAALEEHKAYTLATDF